MAQKILKRGRMGMAAYKQFSSLSPTVPPLVISVEGNIGVGKSTLLLKLENILGKRARFYPEPVADWRNVNGINLLEQMYNHPEQEGISFQFNALLSMVKCHNDNTLPGVCKIIERSLHSSHNIFAKAMLQQGHLSSCQYGVLTLWYQHLCSMEVGHVDHYIFLQRNPKTGLTSIQDRARSEERSLSVDYLELLDSLYESWMQVLLEEGQSMTVIDLSTTAYESAAFKDHIHKICRKVDPSIYL